MREKAISENEDRTTVTQLELLLSKARSVAVQAQDTAVSGLLLEMCTAIDQLRDDHIQLRRDIFRDAVRGLANAIRSNQVPPTIPWAQELPGVYGNNETLAAEIERTHAAEPPTLSELRQLRHKLKSAEVGNDDLDEAIKRVYYSKLFARGPSVEMILPPGSPSRSIDLAALIVQRVMPNGWWTLGCSGENLEDPPLSKVGTWTGDNPKLQSASTTPLALMAAMVLTLIEGLKKEEGEGG